MPKQAPAAVLQYEPETVTFPTYAKYVCMGQAIRALPVRDKRAIFQIMRNTPNVLHNSLLTQYGFTCGEFSMWQILSKQH